MTKTVKYLGSLEDIKKELDEYPHHIKFYMGYMGYHSEDPNSIDFIEQKIKEYLKNQTNESTKN